MAMTILNNIAMNLRIHRKDQHESKEEISRAIGCDRKILNCMEKGDCVPDMLTVLKLCEHFKQTIDSFIYFPAIERPYCQR